ncbi:MAG: DUF4317 domain-containing protein [Clostridiaceae bacterium]|nr:DUF4317 domain-containing protein [Clostridiaceae bacterium]
MRKKDVLELKRRLKKNNCTFTKMSGCYVNGEKNIILNFNETFLNLDEDEFFKYLEIANKTLSGTIGNNLLELEFPLEDTSVGGKQHDLMDLKRSALKNPALLDKFYQSVIDCYDYEGNYLILLFHDAYDVMRKTSDNNKLDESEEVYEYILCAICPVTLSKPGLRYFEDDNRIGARIRDWVVEMPMNGFLFPAFTDRSSDVNSILYYTKNAKDTHPELMEETLGCSSKRTATEQKESFTNIVKNAAGGDDEKSDRLFMEIQENLNNMIDEHIEMGGSQEEPITLTNTAISDLLVESGVPDEITEKIEKSYTEEFGDTPPAVEHLIDKKALTANEQRKRELRLEKQVEILQNKLERTQQAAADIDTTSNIEEDNNSNENYDVVLHVKPEKVQQIKSEIIDGKKCIIIPMEDNEQANVNGVDTAL